MVCSASGGRPRGAQAANGVPASQLCHTCAGTCLPDAASLSALPWRHWPSPASSLLRAASTHRVWMSHISMPLVRLTVVCACLSARAGRVPTLHPYLQSPETCPIRTTQLEDRVHVALQQEVTRARYVDLASMPTGRNPHVLWRAPACALSPGFQGQQQAEVHT